MSQAAFGWRKEVSWWVGGSEAAGFGRAADGWWCSGYWRSLLPAAIRHALMIVSHLLPGRPAASAALSSKTGSSTQISSSRPSAEKPGDRLWCCKPLFHKFFAPLFLYCLFSPLFTFKVPADFFLIPLHPRLPLPPIHLVCSVVHLLHIILFPLCPIYVILLFAGIALILQLLYTQYQHGFS